ncbi:hypothetical protein BC828DRAFT_378680 [Blastocladiella britannica]|nr:hypothetical protein BC828DRAFT_378680 [Blastocladiella britannica]
MNFNFNAPASSAAAAPAPAAGGFGFGKPATPGFALPGAAAVSMAPGSFPMSAAAPTPMFAGAGSLTTTAANAANAAAMAAAAAKPVTMATKYAELPQQYKDQVREIFALIHKQESVCNELQMGSNMGDVLDALESDLSKSAKELASMQLVLGRCLHDTQAIRADIRRELAPIEGVNRLITRDGESAGSSRQWRSNSVTTYLSDKARQLESRAQELSQALTELEEYIHSLMFQAQSTSPSLAADTARAQHNSFLMLSGQVAALHGSVDRVRERYLAYRREYLGATSNPFANSKKRAAEAESGEDSRKSARRSLASSQLQCEPIVQQAPATTAAPAASAPMAASGFGRGFGGFGAPTVTSAAAPAPAFGGFGAAPGAAAATPGSAFQFGARPPTTAAPAAAPAFGGFGAQPPSSSAAAAAPGGFALPGAAAPAAGGFGQPAAPAAAPVGGFGGFGGFGGAPAAAAPAAAPAAGGFQFGFK